MAYIVVAVAAACVGFAIAWFFAASAVRQLEYENDRLVAEIQRISALRRDVAP